MIQIMYDAIPYDSYDRVIAVGGGAIMDLCKLLGCKRPDTVHNLYFKRFPVVHEKDVIAIPTTCGTGSECTNISVAIVKDEKDGVLTGGETKLGLVSDDIIPNKVCLIPELLKTLPYKPFACSAIDALVHATESFLSPHRKTMTSELFSEKAMDMILKGFKLIDEKGQDARFEYMDQFVTASFYAGIAFLKAGCGPVHGMSFPLGGTYHVPHGESNYMLFGAIMDYYDEHKPDGEIMKLQGAGGQHPGLRGQGRHPRDERPAAAHPAPASPAGLRLHRGGLQGLPPVRRGQPAAPDDQRLLSLRPGERRGHLPQVLLKFFQTTQRRRRHAPSPPFLCFSALNFAFLPSSSRHFCIFYIIFVPILFR